MRRAGHHPGQGRADDHHDLEGDPLQGLRGRQLAGGQQRRGERPAARLVDGGERRLDGGEGVEQADLVKASQAWTVSSAETAARALVQPSTSRRVSTASISAPPNSPTASSGSSVASATSPTAAVDRVRSHTCRVSANEVIAPPTADSVDPAQSLRKAGDSRSGVRSARSFTGDDRTAADALPRANKCSHIERSVDSAFSDITDPAALLPVR